VSYKLILRDTTFAPQENVSLLALLVLRPYSNHTRMGCGQMDTQKSKLQFYILKY